MIRQSSLSATNTELFALYHNNFLIGSKELQNTFKISKCKSYKVLDFCYEYMAKNDLKNIAPPTLKQIPRTILFKVYGWDISEINKSVKALSKIQAINIQGD